MLRRAAIDQGASGEIYSPAELRAAIEGFSDTDWLRVKKAALYFSGRCGREWQDLRNEALLRSLDGRRKCPKDVPVTTFLGNVMRSIASEADPTDGHLPLSKQIETQQETPSGLTSLTDPSDPVASTMDAQQLIARAIGAFDGDVVAETLFEGTVDGMEGEELRNLLGLSQKEFDSKRRFVRRRLNVQFERDRHGKR